MLPESPTIMSSTAVAFIPQCLYAWFASHALLCSLNDMHLAITEFMNIIMLQLKNNIDVKCKEKQALDDMSTHLSTLKAHLHDAAGKYLKKWQVA